MPDVVNPKSSGLTIWKYALRISVDRPQQVFHAYRNLSVRTGLQTYPWCAVGAVKSTNSTFKSAGQVRGRESCRQVETPPNL